MKKIFIFIFCIFAFSANSLEKKTTFNKELFYKAQLDGKVVVVNSWTKYCSSCASQMKVLNKAKNEYSEALKKQRAYSKEHAEIFKMDRKNRSVRWKKRMRMNHVESQLAAFDPMALINLVI